MKGTVTTRLVNPSVSFFKPSRFLCSANRSTCVFVCADSFSKSILKNIEIKIIDLEDSVSCPRNLHYIPGTPGYRPPEVYGSESFSQKCILCVYLLY